MSADKVEPANRVGEPGLRPGEPVAGGAEPSQGSAREVGRGVMFIGFAKIYFMLTGTVQYKGWRVDLLSYQITSGWRPFVLIKGPTDARVVKASTD